ILVQVGSTLFFPSVDSDTINTQSFYALALYIIVDLHTHLPSYIHYVGFFEIAVCSFLVYTTEEEVCAPHQNLCEISVQCCIIGLSHLDLSDISCEFFFLKKKIYNAQPELLNVDVMLGHLCYFLECLMDHFHFFFWC
ncbi:hypothetical protein ACJX0J_010763, partial [Zea mays]